MGSASVLPLINVLKDDNPLVRRSIIQALGEIGDVRAVQPIVEMLHDEQVRNIAIQALGEIGDVSAVQSIVEMLWDEKVCQVAIQVLDGFGWEPENSESGALYWIGKQQWNEWESHVMLQIRIPLAGTRSGTDWGNAGESVKLFVNVTLDENRIFVLRLRRSTQPHTPVPYTVDPGKPPGR